MSENRLRLPTPANTPTTYDLKGCQVLTSQGTGRIVIISELDPNCPHPVFEEWGAPAEFEFTLTITPK